MYSVRSNPNSRTSLEHDAFFSASHSHITFSNPLRLARIASSSLSASRKLYDVSTSGVRSRTTTRSIVGCQSLGSYPHTPALNANATSAVLSTVSS